MHQRLSMNQWKQQFEILFLECHSFKTVACLNLSNKQGLAMGWYSMNASPGHQPIEKLQPKVNTKADICSSAGTIADSELQPIVIPSDGLLSHLLLDDGLFNQLKLYVKTVFYKFNCSRLVF
ncbi:hypothetical protein [Niabella terrae]